MSGKITASPELPVLTANIVPFLINYTGVADTHKYFSPSKRVLENTGKIEAQFRGLRLVGVESDLGLKLGYVCDLSEYLQLDPSGSGEAITCKQFVATHTFERLIVFGHEIPPVSSSKYCSIHELDLISEAVHS